MKASSLDTLRWRRRHRPPTLLLLLAAVLATWMCYGFMVRPRSVTTSSFTSSTSTPVHRVPPSSVTHNLEHLQKLVQTSKFTYAQRLVVPRPVQGDRPNLSVGGVEPLFPLPDTLERDQSRDTDAGIKSIKSVTEQRHHLDTLPPIELSTPSSPNADTSIISFGVATPVSRLHEASRQFVHWLKGSGAPLHVISAPNEHASEMQSYMCNLGIDTTIEMSQNRTPIAFFSLVQRLYETRRPQTKWIALIDDDTFIPSLPTLVHHLSTTYRADREIMVTAMSDNIEQIEAWGMQAFGGGGIFLSIPLAARLSQPAIWEKCLELAKSLGQGDQIVTRCLNTYTDVRPVFDPGLHQMDILGPEDTPAGYFESGRRMLTVHHWRTWFRVDIPKGLQVSHACGPEGLFQRWVFPKSNMVLSNGFSIAEYPNGLAGIDFSAVEKTWQGDEVKFLHKIGPLRKPLGSDKISYRLVDAEVVDKWFVRQTYIHRGKPLEGGDGDHDDREESEVDRVLELLWLL